MLDLNPNLAKLLEIADRTCPISTLRVDVLKGLAINALANGNSDQAVELLEQALDFQAPAVRDSRRNDTLAETYALLAIVQAIVGLPDKSAINMRSAIKVAKSDDLRRVYIHLPLPAAAREGK